jgi:hypothetical protein
MTGELDVQPINPNQLQAHKFQVTINRFPNVTFWAQSFNVPGISLESVAQVNLFTDIKRPGNKIKFDPLTMTIILDEDLWAWSEIMDWMSDAGNKESFQGRKDLTNSGLNPAPKDITSQILITLLSSKNNQRTDMIFHWAWPSQLSGFDYNASADAETTITCTVTFEYTFYEIKRNSLFPVIS